MRAIWLAALLLPALAGAGDLDSWERKAEMNPDDPAAQFNFAVKAWEAGEFKKALKAVERVLKLSPDDAVAWELKGQIHLDLGQEEPALQAMEKCLDLDAQRARARLALAKMYAKKEDRESTLKALQAYEAVSAAMPKDAALIINQGVLLNRLGREKEALARFEKAAKIDRKGLAARYLCPLYNRFGDFKKAESACRAASQEGTAEMHYNLGYALSRLGRKDEARRSFEAAVRAAPDYAPALYSLGYYDYEEGRLEQALARFQSALQARQGDYPEAQYNVAVILGEQGKWGEAAEIYRKLLKKDPGNEDAKANLAYVIEAGTEDFLNRGKDAYEAGDFDAAAQWWREALRLDPGNTTASEFLAKVQKQDAGLQAARRAARQAVASRLKSQDEKALEDGLAAFKAGKLSQAVKLLDYYVKRHPGNAKARQTLFQARSELRQQVDDLLARARRAGEEGQTAEAKSLLQKALALDPASGRVQKMLAEVTGSTGAVKSTAEQLKKAYFQGVDAYLEGDLPKAISIWEKILAQDPKHLDAKRSVAQAKLELAALKKHK